MRVHEVIIFIANTFEYHNSKLKLKIAEIFSENFFTREEKELIFHSLKVLRTKQSAQEIIEIIGVEESKNLKEILYFYCQIGCDAQRFGKIVTEALNKNFIETSDLKQMILIANQNGYPRMADRLDEILAEAAPLKKIMQHMKK